MNILIGINNLTSVDQKAYANHIQAFYSVGKKHPDWKVYFYNPTRASIDRMRNECARLALESEVDYLIFLDDDVLIAPSGIIDLVERIEECKYDVVAGVTCIRGFPFYPMLFDFSNKENHYILDFDACSGTPRIKNCDAVGFSFCAISAQLLRKVLPPLFVTGPGFTEDVFFCLKAKEMFPDVKIGFAPDITTGHILGTDIISYETRQLWIDFDKKRFPGLKEKEEIEIDRGEEYTAFLEAQDAQAE